MQKFKYLCAAFSAGNVGAEIPFKKRKRNIYIKNFYFLIILCVLTFIFVSCSSRIGYGVLIWSVEDPPVKSGTVLPVYMRSNIEKIWVVGLPESVSTDSEYKFEISFPHMEFTGSKRLTQKRLREFAPFAALYAENMQDRLPIREYPDNSSKQVYRLRAGEVIKIIGSTENGIQPIGTSGDPLEGDWYRVMTNDGVTGYCFSNRLKIYNENDVIEEIDSETEIAAEKTEETPAQEVRVNRIIEYTTFLNRGPVFTSNNYGTFTLTRDGTFTWTDFDLLVPHVIPSGTTGTGLVKTNIRVSHELDARYTGAVVFEFNNARSFNSVNFLLGFDNQGLRLEYVPQSRIRNEVVMSRDSSPTVIYFYRDSR